MCGIAISKYFSIKRRKTAGQENKKSLKSNDKPEHTPGKGRESVVPPDIKRWNWGAFFLNFIWAIGNKTWIGLLTLVPVACYVMPIVLGFKGNEWAWKNKRWDNIDHFKKVQKRWSRWGVSLFITFFVCSLVLLEITFYTGEPKIGKHVASVEWLPSSATDINYYIRGGFAWIKNYDCSIPEDDFLIFAKKNNWELREKDNVLFYEKRHSNGGGVTAHYDKISKRLYVYSNHH